MANTLTGLIPVLYDALDVVRRELFGFIPAVSRDSGIERAALNQTVSIPVVPAATAADLTPGQLPPDTGDAVIGKRDLTITKARAVPVRWSGEETRAIQSGGQYNTILRDRWVQAFRTLTNEIETDIAATYALASRACGSASAVPFATAGNLSDGAAAHRILDDNGAPQSDLHLVLGSSAMANIRGVQSVLFKVNEAGTDELLRRGTIGELQGFELHNSAQVRTHTKGTGSGYLSDLVAGYAADDTAIHVDTGTGTILAGDVVTWNGDSNKYIVTTGFAGDGDGDITLSEPGLRAALANDVALSIGNSYTANMAFHRSAIALATRFPAMPDGGDSADDTMAVTDPVTGMSFEVAVYREFLQVHYQVRLVWGVNVIKPEFMVVLMGS